MTLQVRGRYAVGTRQVTTRYGEGQYFGGVGLAVLRLSMHVAGARQIGFNYAKTDLRQVIWRCE